MLRVILNVWCYNLYLHRQLFFLPSYLCWYRLMHICRYEGILQFYVDYELLKIFQFRDFSNLIYYCTNISGSHYIWRGLLIFFSTYSVVASMNTLYIYVCSCVCVCVCVRICRDVYLSSEVKRAWCLNYGTYYKQTSLKMDVV